MLTAVVNECLTSEIIQVVAMELRLRLLLHNVLCEIVAISQALPATDNDSGHVISDPYVLFDVQQLSSRSYSS